MKKTQIESFHQNQQRTFLNQVNTKTSGKGIACDIEMQNLKKNTLKLPPIPTHIKIANGTQKKVH